jgi:hypothetical protein
MSVPHAQYRNDAEERYFPSVDPAAARCFTCWSADDLKGVKVGGTWKFYCRTYCFRWRPNPEGVHAN